MKRFRSTLLLALLAASFVRPSPSLAQNNPRSWQPSRPVMFIVPNGVAGTSDRAAQIGRAHV